MKAIVCGKYGPPEVLKVKEVERPVPRDNEVLIRIHAAVVSATDPVVRKGEPAISRLFSGLTRPKKSIPGDSLAGEIEAVGRDVKRFKRGEGIYGATGLGLGAHAEYISLPEDAALAIKPANMSYAESVSLCDGALTAVPFLRDTAHIRNGQKVLINGASGAIGTIAVQLARYYGAEVTGVCSRANLELVMSLGADRAIDYTAEDFTQDGRSYDIVFDTVGKRSFSECRNSLTEGGIYLTTFPKPAVLLRMLLGSKRDGKQARFAATGLRPAEAKAKDLDFVRKLAEAGKLKAVIDRRYAMEQIADAHRYVETGRKKGSVVLRLGDD